MSFFITFEGIEGCGKSTQVQRLASRLSALGADVVLTREPGGCPIADQIRSILLDAANGALTPTAELLLYAAARAQHVAEVVRPALQAGKIVICDRFTDATIAYQGYGRGLDLAAIERLNAEAASGTVPDLTLLLDCPVETGLRRAMERINNSSGAREERFELESIQFHQRVRNGYLSLAAQYPGRFVVIDGSLGIDETAATILAAISPRMGIGP